MSATKWLYIHCTIGISEDDEEIVKLPYQPTLTADEVIRHFAANWPKVLGPHRVPTTMLQLERLDTGALLEGGTRLQEYPAGGDVAVVVRKTNLDLYLHFDSEALADTLLQGQGESSVTEVLQATVKTSFLSCFGKSSAALAKAFLADCRDTEVKEHLEQLQAKGWSLTVSPDGRSPLAGDALVLTYPEGGDLFIVPVQPAKEKATKSNPPSRSPAAVPGASGAASSKNADADPTETLTVELKQGRGVTRLTFDYKRSRPWQCGNLLKEIGLRLNLNPLEVAKVVCLTADERTVIPDDYLLTPAPNLIYHLRDRPAGVTGHPEAAGASPPGLSSAEMEARRKREAVAREERQAAEKALKEYLDTVDKYNGEEQFARAIHLLNQLNEKVPEGPAKLPLFQRLGLSYAGAGKFDRSAQYYQQAVELEPTNVPLLVALGKTLHDAKRYPEAADVFLRALQLVRQADAKVAPDVLKEIQLRLGIAKYSADKSDEGIALIQPIAVNDTTVGEAVKDLSLMWMSRVYIDKGYAEDAASVAVQLVVKYQQRAQKQNVARGKKTKDQTVYQRNFVEVMKLIPNCVEFLRDAVFKDRMNSEEAASAWGWLGLVMRDHSLMEESKKCYQISLQQNNRDAQVALNYVHLLEQNGEPHASLVWLQNWLRDHGDLSVSGVTAAKVADLMGDAAAWPQTPQEGADRMKGAVPRRRYVRLINCKVVTYETKPSLEPELKVENDDRSEYLCGLSEEQLSLMAMFMQGAKVLFSLGALDLMPGLLEGIDPPRHSERLYRTNIRNENAYFSTIAMLMQYLDPESQPIAFDAEMYFVGDSHSMPPSWHVIDANGRRTMLVNSIVTGLKCWHLRPNADFFPKRNFERVVERIPEGADAIFLFGEIDCRESVLRNIERGRYDSADECMEVAIRHYLEALRAVKARRHLNAVYVHAVLPVITVTRHLVLPFNVVLKRIVQKDYLDLRYLDVEVVVPNNPGNPLKEGLILDGTHINPRYIVYLEAAFAALQQ